MLYLDENNRFQITTDPKEILIRQVNCELNLFKGENPLNTNLGVNYQAVMNGEAFLAVEVQNTLNRYSDRFQKIEIGKPIQQGDFVSLNVTLDDVNLEVKVV